MILQEQNTFLIAPNYYKTCTQLLGTFLQYLGLVSGQHDKPPYTRIFPMSLYLSMAAFALAASISPGPVNIVALGSGARHGLRASLAHVAGATLGFCLLLVLVGLGLHALLLRWPLLGVALHWGGVAFLLYLAWKLASDNGQLGGEQQQRAPSAWEGAAMQWLNPKAWLAAVAGVAAYTGGEQQMLWLFTWIYGPICFVSVASWAWAGSMIQQYLRKPRYLQMFNRGLALLLVISALYLLV
jgi:threonine/homoserine/homoserine lactone efflux protein